MKLTKQDKVLAIETCSNICSVALWDGQQLHTQVSEVERSHSKALLPMIEQLLLAAQCSMSDIDYIACTRGPGSFTGVRIGIGVAKGLAFGQDIPIIPISPLQALAYRIAQTDPNTKELFAILDARMGEVYAANYKLVDDIPLLQGQELLTTADNLSVNKLLVGGTGAHEYQDVFISNGAKLSEVLYPLAADLIAIAQQQQDLQTVTASELTPVYLRDKVVD